MRKCDEDRIFKLELTYEENGEVHEVKSWELYMEDFDIKGTIKAIKSYLMKRHDVGQIVSAQDIVYPAIGNHAGPCKKKKSK